MMKKLPLLITHVAWSNSPFLTLMCAQWPDFSYVDPRLPIVLAPNSTLVGNLHRYYNSLGNASNPGIQVRRGRKAKRRRRIHSCARVYFAHNICHARTQQAHVSAQQMPYACYSEEEFNIFVVILTDFVLCFVAVICSRSKTYIIHNKRMAQ